MGIMRSSLKLPQITSIRYVLYIDVTRFVLKGKVHLGLDFPFYEINCHDRNPVPELFFLFVYQLYY